MSGGRIQRRTFRNSFPMRTVRCLEDRAVRSYLVWGRRKLSRVIVVSLLQLSTALSRGRLHCSFLFWHGYHEKLQHRSPCLVHWNYQYRYYTKPKPRPHVTYRTSLRTIVPASHVKIKDPNALVFIVPWTWYWYYIASRNILCYVIAS